MIKSDGVCKITGITLGEISIKLLEDSLLVAKYAFCDAAGDRYGYGNRNVNWSDETLEKLKALATSMEEDICRDLFEGGVTTGSTDEVVAYQQDGVPGL